MAKRTARPNTCPSTFRDKDDRTILLTAMRAALLPIVASVVCSGCLSSITLVKVSADGSGTIELTTTVRKAGLAQFDDMLPSEAPKERPRLEAWFPEERARRVAASLGTRVSFVSSRAIESAELLGRHTTYSFADVRQLSLDILPLLPLGTVDGSNMLLVGEADFTFDLRDGPEGRVLVARFPDAQIEYADADGAARSAATVDPREAAMLRKLLAGSRVEIAIEPELSILQTNTTHRSGQRVTLLGIDAERLLLDKDAPDRLRLRPASIDELRHELHDAPGVTVALDREIRIHLAVPSGAEYRSNR